MIPDDEGFLYPQIDGSQCVNCKKCEKTCPVLQKPRVSESVQAYAVQNMDQRVRCQSSSGGVFTALAEQVIKKGGAVCAAVYNDQFEVEHRIAFTVEELAPMRGAKYSQSHAGYLFRALKELLESGKPVIFTGTPCQCAGLKTYLGKEYEQLLLVDMVCHGVPAPSVWKEYVRRRRELDANGAELSSINLRDKSTGWSRYAYSVKFQYANGSVYCVPQGQDPYMRGFVGDLYLRPSCSVCSFKGINRCSDLTLGDCWGIWDSHPDFDDNRGTSLLLVHTAKGQQIWNQLCADFASVAFAVEDVTRYNPSAESVSRAHSGRGEFFRRLSAGESVDGLIGEVLSPKVSRQSLIKRVVKRILGRHSM
jgi:coenzyme F420-reducing hydrogenase beta subunit